MAFIMNYVKDTAAGYMKTGMEYGGTYAGNAVGGVGTMIENSGRGLGEGSKLLSYSHLSLGLCTVQILTARVNSCQRRHLERRKHGKWLRSRHHKLDGRRRARQPTRKDSCEARS